MIDTLLTRLFNNFLHCETDRSWEKKYKIAIRIVNGSLDLDQNDLILIDCLRLHMLH